MIRFEKFQGTGNDFIVIDNRKSDFDDLPLDSIRKLCNRRFGIGADGLIWVKNHAHYDFEMRYFNADGSSSFCGNGARCAVKFAKSLNMFSNTTKFLAFDGVHEARITEGIIHLKMNDVSNIEVNEEAYVIDTGSPHFIKFVDDLAQIDIVGMGKEIRFSEKYRKEGINVNAVSKENNGISLLTYERGVEDETLSCGTGATAAALALVFSENKLGDFELPVKVKGGNLSISGFFDGKTFTNVYLSGPAEKVFDGTISI